MSLYLGGGRVKHTGETQLVLQSRRYQAESLGIHKIKEVAEATEKEYVPLDALS